MDARVEPHRESGSLVALVEQPGLIVHLEPGQQKRFRLEIPETTENAWASIREMLPGRGFQPVLGVTGQTDCLAGNQLHTAVREVAHPMSNPWFDGHLDELQGARLAVVNTSEAAATVTGCYSGGTLIANPNVPGGGTLTPLCTYRFREQIPPFSARQFPVQRQGSSHFSLRTSGRAIALQMLRLLDAGTQLFEVDTSIRLASDLVDSVEWRAPLRFTAKRAKQRLN